MDQRRVGYILEVILLIYLKAVQSSSQLLEK